jgi:hypothetical protein
MTSEDPRPRSPECGDATLVVGWTRPRASTKTLLGEEIKKEAPGPPKPMCSSKFSITQLKERLHWADSVLSNRGISPIRQYQLANYKNACRDALKSELKIEDGDLPPAEIEQRRISWAATLRWMEESEQWRLCLEQTNTKDGQEFQQKILELLTIELYARYGDILASVCKILKVKVSQMSLEGALPLKAYWTTIDSKLTLEKKDYDEMLASGENKGKTPLHITIKAGCDAIGFEFQQLMDIIHVYATRNEKLHSNFLPLVREGNVPAIAKTLQDDLNDLTKVIPRERATEVKILQQLITTLIDKWFIKKEGHEDNYLRWTASNDLDYFIDEVENANPDKEAREWQTISSAVAKELGIRLKKSKKDKEMETLIGGMDELHKLVTAKGPCKRVASSQLEFETKRQKQATEMWRTLSTTVRKAYKLADDYKEEFKELCAPPSGIVHDPSLDI